MNATFRLNHMEILKSPVSTSHFALRFEKPFLTFFVSIFQKIFFINFLLYFNIPKDLFFQNDIFNFNLKDTSCLNNKRQTALSAESKLSFQISFVTRHYANLRI